MLGWEAVCTVDNCSYSTRLTTKRYASSYFRHSIRDRLHSRTDLGQPKE
jgi:hypothetical protein